MDTAREPGQTSIGPHDPVARDDERKTVRRVRAPDRPRRRLPPSSHRRDFVVRPPLSERNARESLPHGSLPDRATKGERRIETPSLSSAVFEEFRAGGGGSPGILREREARVFELGLDAPLVVPLLELEPQEGSSFVHGEDDGSGGRFYGVQVSSHVHLHGFVFPAPSILPAAWESAAKGKGHAKARGNEASSVSGTSNTGRGRESAGRRASDESGIIVFGGGDGCAGRGCLFWIIVSVVASVVLTVLANLLLVLL